MIRVRRRVSRIVCAGAFVAVVLALELPALGQSMSRGSPQTPAGNARNSSPRRRTPYYRPQSGAEVQEVRITGNRYVSVDKIRSYLKTRSNRVFDPQLVQADVRKLILSGLFRDVRTYTQPVAGGIVVTFEVFERPSIGHVHFVGNRRVKDKVLLRESGLKVGDPLNAYSASEARRKLEEHYRSNGYSDAQVTLIEGDKPEHGGVAFRIHEGQLQRILWTRFEGNTIASDNRLRTQIQSKHGILWLFKGKVDRRKIDEDKDRLYAYYRSLGFFGAKIGRELEFDKKGKWLTITFTINEGPRYRVRDVRTIGNEKFPSEELLSRLDLKSGDYFNLGRLRRDENTLRDIYGSQGHIMANIKAEPRFLEEPGELDLIYEIDEGHQYRVGRVFVNIEGDHAHTRRTVVLNRVSLRPGDIVDIREVRNSERRLKLSQLFLNDPVQGITPRIVVKPSELGSGASFAKQRGRRTHGRSFRGQSPETDVTSAKRLIPTSFRGSGSHLVDVHVYVQPKSEISGSAP